MRRSVQTTSPVTRLVLRVYSTHAPPVPSTVRASRTWGASLRPMPPPVCRASALRAWSVLPVCFALMPLLPAGGGDPPCFHLKALKVLAPGEQAGAHAIDENGRVAGFVQ